MHDLESGFMTQSVAPNLQSWFAESCWRLYEQGVKSVLKVDDQLLLQIFKIASLSHFPVVGRVEKSRILSFLLFLSKYLSIRLRIIA